MSVHSRSNWNLEVLVFNERRKPDYAEKNLSEQSREPTTNSTHIWHQHQVSNLGHIGGRRVLSPLHHLCFQKILLIKAMINNKIVFRKIMVIHLLFVC